MKLSIRYALLILVQGVATCLLGQTASPTAATSNDPLATILPSCGGSWESIRRASAEVRVLDAPMTREAREQILCLLDGINKTTFDKDPQYDNLMASQFTRVVIMAYSKAGLDFFAEQLPQQPERVGRGIATVLLDYGHPVAVRQYFELRRAKLARGETWNRESSIALGAFGSFLEDGNCGDSICSDHVAESIALIQANLDIVDMELAAIEKRATPESRSPQTVADAQRERMAASRLRNLVGRIQRGEVAIGAGGKSK